MRNRIAVAVAVAVSILLGAVVVAPTLTGDVLAGIGALGFFGSFALMFWSRFRWRIAGSVLGAGVALMVAGNAIVPADVREARAEERDAREAERAERDRRSPRAGTTRRSRALGEPAIRGFTGKRRSPMPSIGSFSRKR